MNDKTRHDYRILVTDAYELSGLGAIRSLGRSGYSVIAGYSDQLPKPVAMASRYCNESACYPDPWHSIPDFQQWILECVANTKIDAILPVTEAVIVALDEIRDELAKYTQLLAPSGDALRYTLSKYHATKKAIELGIQCPKTVFVSDGTPYDASQLDLDQLGAPIIIKMDNQLTEHGVYRKGKTLIAESKAQALELLDEFSDLGVSIIAQEYVSGYGVGAFLLRRNGNITAEFCHRRLHEVPFTGGYSSFRESIYDRDLLDQSTKLLDAIDLDYLAMVEFRKNSLDGRPYFMEINGRLWGSIALALHAGVDFPRLLVDGYRGSSSQSMPISSQPNYTVGLRCRNLAPNEVFHLLSVLKGLPQKLPLTTVPSRISAVWEFVRLSFDPSIRYDVLWWSDPIPGLLKIRDSVVLFAGIFIEKVSKKLKSKYTRMQLSRWLKKFDQSAMTNGPCLSSDANILFVCFGNICRSPFAEFYWNQKRQHMPQLPKAISSGFYHRQNRRSPLGIIQAASTIDVDLNTHRSKLITEQQVEQACLIVLMDAKNHNDFVQQFPNAKNKMVMLGFLLPEPTIEINDPYEMDQHDRIDCFTQMKRALDGLAQSFDPHNR